MVTGRLGMIRKAGVDPLVRCLVTGSRWTLGTTPAAPGTIRGRDQEGEGRREPAGLAEISSGSPSD